MGLALALAFAVAQPCLSAPQGLRFTVRVVEPGGRPVANATILVFSLRTIKAVYLGFTNASGWAEGAIPAGDNYIIYVMRGEGGRLTHVPVRIDISDYTNVERLTAEVTLYPAARVNVSGKVIYIGGVPTGTARIVVLDREGEPISTSLSAGKASLVVEGREVEVKPQVVDVYGPARDYTFIKRGLGFEAVKVNEGLVPVGQPVRVRVEYGVLDMRTFTVKSLGVELGSRENPLVFKEGQVETVDLLKVSIEGQLQSLKADLAEARSQVDAYEAMGFYIPEIHDLVRSGEELLGGAEQLFARGEAPEKVVALMERVYAIANDQVPRRLGFLRDVAKVGATVMPSFLAVFAAILAFYFFDSQRAKILSFTLIYAGLVLLFSYIYPGFRLLWSLDRTLFLATVGGAYAVFFVIAFLLPRVIKEPELPGEVALGGLIAVAFTLGKRYSKVKALRTSITIFSIAAFIWAFTVLATFGVVYTKIEDRNFAKYPVNVVILKRVVNDTLQPLNAELDPLLFEGREGVGSPSLVVMNRPDVSLSVAVSVAGREAVLRFAMGISPAEVRRNPALASAVTLLGEMGSDGVLLPQSVWSSLGLRGGEEVSLSFEAQGYGIAKVRARAVGYFNEAAFENVKDPDGMPLRPFIQRGGRTLYANTTDLIIVPPQLLLSLFAPSEGGYSQVFYVYRISAESSSEAAGLSFINDAVDRRGESYVAISCYGGSCTRVYYGTRVQSIFEQEITFFVPLLIVIANVLITMLSIVRERRREIFIFMTVGFNPRHIALVFLAEAIVYGLLSGGFGYIAGLSTFRALSAFAAHQNLMVREKLEWYWSYLAIALAVLVSILGAIKPSMDAAYMFAPTEVRRLKVAEVKERVRRAEYVSRTAAAKTFSIPGEVAADEGEVAFSYIYSRLADLSYGELEAVEGLTDHPMEERPDGTRIKRFTFRYISTTELGAKVAIDCELRFVLSPGAEKYRVELDTRPVGQAPISHMDYAADLVKRIIGDWMAERERLLYAA